MTDRNRQYARLEIRHSRKAIGGSNPSLQSIKIRGTLLVSVNALNLDTKESYMPIKKSVRIIKKIRDEDGQWRFVSLRHAGARYVWDKRPGH